MGDRTILCGCIHLSEAAFKKAQNTPLMKMSFMASNDPDECDVVMKGVKAKDLFASQGDEYARWAKNAYDKKKTRWVFGVSLHDDDLPNANTDDLPKKLAALKDRAGTDFVVAWGQWSERLQQAWRIGKTRGAEMETLPDEVPKSVAKLMVAAKYAEAMEKLSPLLAEASEDE